MSRVSVQPLQVVDKPNDMKKLEAEVTTEFTVDCDCDQISVKIYTHVESMGGIIITPSGIRSKGDVDDPQGVSWEWTPGNDGWITDSVDADPETDSFSCRSGPNGNIVKFVDKPGMIIPPGSQGAGYSYEYQFTWKIDVLCSGQVIDHEYYRLSLTGSGSDDPSGPTAGDLSGETERRA